jgi:hypothetical protein
MSCGLLDTNPSLRLQFNAFGKQARHSARNRVDHSIGTSIPIGRSYLPSAIHANWASFQNAWVRIKMIEPSHK